MNSLEEALKELQLKCNFNKGNPILKLSLEKAENFIIKVWESAEKKREKEVLDKLTSETVQKMMDEQRVIFKFEESTPSG